MLRVLPDGKIVKPNSFSLWLLIRTRRTRPTVSNYNFSSFGTKILVRTVGRGSPPNLSGWVPAAPFTTSALLVFLVPSGLKKTMSRVLPDGKIVKSHSFSLWLLIRTRRTRPRITNYICSLYSKSNKYPWTQLAAPSLRFATSGDPLLRRSSPSGRENFKIPYLQNGINNFVRPEGLEPSTVGLKGRCSTN